MRERLPLLPPGPDAPALLRGIGGLVDWMIIVIGATMILLVFCNVIFHITGRDIAWTTELCEFLMVWVTFHLQAAGEVVYYIGIVVVFSGLGRLYSKMKVGSAGKYFDNIMIVEIVLGIAIIVLHSLINQTI